MLSTSYEFRRKLAQNSKVRVKATLTLADGTTQTLAGDDIMKGGMSFDDSVCQGGKLAPGAAIVNRCSLTLNNCDERFSLYDFEGATIVPYVGVDLDAGGVEWLRKGVYGVEQPDAYSGTIGLECLDNMRLLTEVPYTEVSTHYPATLRTIAMDICRVCGVTLANTDFQNCTYSVPVRPDSDRLTCQAMIAYVAQAAGCWARFNEWGNLVIEWFDLRIRETEDWLDGMVFDDASPYASGDTADGGNFIDYTSGAVADGGNFDVQRLAMVSAVSQTTVFTDDVVVTGIQVTAQDGDEADEDGEVALWGTAGYVIAIEGNPLITYGKAAEVAEQVGRVIVGMRFRPLDVSALCNPAVEAGDAIIVTDRRQYQYLSYLTRVSYKVGSYQTYACDAPGAGRNRAESYSALASDVVAARRAVRQERTDRELAVEHLAYLLANSSGLYMTTDVQQDGSTIYYMHDKPTLQESMIVWKLTANALGISHDGGATYPYGLDVSGNAILNRVYAIGLDADYINTGAISIRRNGQQMFLADYDTGEVYISADSVTIGTERLTTAIDGVRAVYGTCTTAAGTRDKVVTCSGFALRTGAVVNVRFTYANTAANPRLNVNGTGAKAIYLADNPLPSAYYWSAGDCVTFVYNGSYWYVADSGALSKIKVTPDSISLSVSNGAIGSQASIVLSVNGTQKATGKIDMRGVRNAFKNDTTAITITGGAITFNSNTFVVNSTYFKVTADGTITASAGKIGGFTIGASSLYSGKTALGSLTAGVYLGSDGISVGSGSAFLAIKNGQIYGGNTANTARGEIFFYNPFSRGIGTRIGGYGGIAFCTADSLFVQGWNGQGALYGGQTKTWTIPEKPGSDAKFLTDASSVGISKTLQNKRVWMITGFDGNSWSITELTTVDGGFVTDAWLQMSRYTFGSYSIGFNKGLMTTG